MLADASFAKKKQMKSDEKILIICKLRARHEQVKSYFLQLRLSVSKNEKKYIDEMKLERPGKMTRNYV